MRSKLITTLLIFLLSISLTILITSASLEKMTRYENLKPLLENSLKKFLEKNLKNEIAEIENFCEKTNETFSLTIFNKTINITCQNYSRDVMLEKLASSFIDSFYYKKYNCSFVECLKKDLKRNSPILISKEGNLFYKRVKKTAATSILFLLILLGLLYSSRVHKLLILVGSWLIFLSLPLIITPYFQDNFLEFFAGTRGIEVIVPLLSEFLNLTQSYAKICLAIGTCILGVGYLLKYHFKRKSS